MTDRTSPDILLTATKQKYKAAIPGFILVVFSFIAEELLSLPEMRYLSLIGLFWFLAVMVLYRVNRCVVPVTDNLPVAPIGGKIVDINNEGNKTVITIEKSPLGFADIRTSLVGDVSINNKNVIEYNNNIFNTMWSIEGWRLIIFTQQGQTQADLLGMLIGKGVCRYTLPEKYNLLHSVGDKVVAGESILGELK